MSVFSACFFGTTAFVLAERPVLYLSRLPDHGQDVGTLDTVQINRETTGLHTFSFLKRVVSIAYTSKQLRYGTEMKDVSTFQ